VFEIFIRLVLNKVMVNLTPLFSYRNLKISVPQTHLTLALSLTRCLPL